MKRGTILKFAACIAVVGMAAGCGGGSKSSKASFKPEIATSAPAGDKQVDSITWNVGAGEPDSMDPAMSANDSISTINGNLCESLMRYGSNYAVEPALASSVQHPDSLTWIFHLREGVTFWDGSPVTAADVVYSIERILDPKLGSSWAAWAPDGATARAIDDKTVELKVTKFNSTAEGYFATPAFSVVSKKFAAKAGKAFGTDKGGVMCTGAYKIASWNTGESLTITRNDLWWDKDNAPKVKNVKFVFVSDPAAQTAGLVSGDIDGQFNLQVGSYKQLSKAGGRLLFARSLAPVYLDVLKSDGALGDQKVRQAIQKSIDYEGIVKSVYLGAADPLRALVPPNAWGEGPQKAVYERAYNELPEAKQDLGGAKKLIADSPDAKKEIVFAYATASGEETKIATAIADSANSIGLNIKLKPLTGADYNALFSSEEARAGVDMFLVSGYLDFPDPLPYYGYLAIGSYYNFSNYKNQEYTDHIKAAFNEQDPAKKAELTSKAQAIIGKDLQVTPILTTFTGVYYNKSLGGLVPSQSFYYTPWAAQLGGS